MGSTSPGGEGLQQGGGPEKMEKGDLQENKAGRQGGRFSKILQRIRYNFSGSKKGPSFLGLNIKISSRKKLLFD